MSNSDKKPKLTNTPPSHAGWWWMKTKGRHGELRPVQIYSFTHKSNLCVFMNNVYCIDVVNADVFWSESAIIEPEEMINE